MKDSFKILLSAYACEPYRGSEPAVGWNFAREISRYHQVWVITRANNREVIEKDLENNPLPNIRWVYFDLPDWMSFYKRGNRGVHLYYYLWQWKIFSLARRLHRSIGFDFVHHLTFVNYWMPSFLDRLSVPFIWGPLGGGESVPRPFWSGFGTRGILHEGLRKVIRRMGEANPQVRSCARRSVLTFATTRDTALRLRKIGASKVTLFSQLGINEREWTLLEKSNSPSPVFRFISIGRLVHLKGFHLSIEAFARARIEGSEYWIVGEGSERERLEALCCQLGIEDRVFFQGRLGRKETLETLSQSQVLVHPSLRESGGMVCLEAMAGGVPVICFDLAGMATLVSEDCGIKIPARNPNQALKDFTRAMVRLAGQPQEAEAMGRAGKKRAREVFDWKKKGEFLHQCYQSLKERERR